MSSRRTLRIYVVELEDGRLLGALMRTRESFFDSMPPAYYGQDLAEVTLGLERALKRLLATQKDEIDRYLFTEAFEVRAVDVEVHPATIVKKQPVVGARHVPLRLSFATSKTRDDYYRVMLPRFSWWLFLEDLETAKEVLGHAISSAFLGASPMSMFEFRRQGREWVEEWEPDWLRAHQDPRFDFVRVAGSAAQPRVAQVADDWVERARVGKLPRAAGPDPSFVEEAKRYTLPVRPSLLLVGERGVGKTTFVRRLVRQLLRFQREHVDAPTRLYATSAERIFAGMVYLGMWQQRCLDMVQELDGEDHILYVGPLLPLLARQSDGSAIADFFVGPMSEGTLPMIAECTESELAVARRRAGRFLDAFTIVRLTEPDRATMVDLLGRRAEQLGLHVTAQAAERMVRLLGTYARTTRFPGKGFAFVERIAETDPGARLSPAEVDTHFARFVGLPFDLISDSRSATIAEITESLRAGVIGQDDACTRAAGVLARFKAGLSDPEKPLGNLLFVGPTGVGKTELAKQLARVMFGDAERVVRVDLSEYMNPGAAQRLRRVGRGVRSLAERVHREPLSLVLFDEVEKAHPEVFDLLLGILGEGRLTDDLGRMVDFRMTIVVLTSNLGADRGPVVGFGATDEKDYERSVREFFRPELTNRMDHVIRFSSLTRADLLRIVDLELTRSLRRPGIARRRLNLLIDATARARLAELGFDPRRGARPLRRTIEERVFTPLAARIASDPNFRDRDVHVVARDTPAFERLGDADAIIVD